MTEHIMQFFAFEHLPPHLIWSEERRSDLIALIAPIVETAIASAHMSPYFVDPELYAREIIAAVAGAEWFEFCARAAAPPPAGTPADAGSEGHDVDADSEDVATAYRLEVAALREEVARLRGERDEAFAAMSSDGADAVMDNAVLRARAEQERAAREQAEATGAALRGAVMALLAERTIASVIKGLSPRGRNQRFARDVPEYAADCDSVTAAVAKVRAALATALGDSAPSRSEATPPTSDPTSAPPPAGTPAEAGSEEAFLNLNSTVEWAEDGAPIYVHASDCPSYCDYACNGSAGDESAKDIEAHNAVLRGEVERLTRELEAARYTAPDDLSAARAEIARQRHRAEQAEATTAAAVASERRVQARATEQERIIREQQARVAGLREALDLALDCRKHDPPGCGCWVSLALAPAPPREGP